MDEIASNNVAYCCYKMQMKMMTFPDLIICIL